ncbi:sugar-binding transcriptional regulator [Plastorhodobacter daqingensis]|uniref:Sugar-binding transcriptional regulator n=1 Tax=Plastorhodobacter daqingensis TaxID=1387281 RepID=A0ABW2UJY8_9RHOB
MYISPAADRGTPPVKAPANRLPLDAARDQLMIRVARMAYQQDRSHTEIAAETGLNRWQVSRLLQEARDQGIVRIEIIPHVARKPDVESALLRRFGLRDAVVVPTSPGSDDSAALAHAAGQYLAALHPRPGLLGLSWGRTMDRVAQWLPDGWSEDVCIVQINGTVAPLPHLASGGALTDVAGTFARKGNGRMVPLPVPAIVGAAATRAVLEQDRIVADVLALARAAPVLVFSAGVAGPDSALLRSGNVLGPEMDQLVAQGAVGDVLGHFIDRHGQPVMAELEARTIGLTLDDLRRAACTILVATGTAKRDVTLGALRAGLIRTLVADEPLATQLLEHADDP